MNNNLKEFRVLQPPFISIEAEVIENSRINGKQLTKKKYREYKIAPSAKKIATYIVNHILGSELIVPDTDINWLMPSLQEALEQAIYCKESFIYLHKFGNKVYLETIRPNQIFDLVQKYDRVYSGTIVEKSGNLELHRIIQMQDGKTILELEAYEIKDNGKEVPISIARYDQLAGTHYEKDKFILPYEVLINIDAGKDFFQDSRKLLTAEMNVVDTLMNEIKKTETKVITSQHFQTGNIVQNWRPQLNYNVQTMDVNGLQDYFTLMPGDKDHFIFQYAQGDIRVKDYVDTFKFYDYQIIQMAGLSPATFGYEKDSYMNEANVDLSADASEMTIEAIKTQITGQINSLFENIYKMQRSQNDITEDLLPEVAKIEWDFGADERIDDQKKIQILKEIQGVTNVPYNIKAEIVAPLLERLIDNSEDLLDRLKEGHDKERGDIKVTYGEL